MCGIAGAVGPDAEARVKEMICALAHRGPDGSGMWGESGVALGHTRLAIIDPSPRADQPFVRGSRALVFNGEIYNHIELRSELSARGFEFTTTSDTEVLLAAYDEWGRPGLGRLEGMFAFALWDTADQSLLLARDRHGMKPLYWRSASTNGSRGTIAFASEVSALADPTRRDIDPDAVREFLRFGAPISRPIAHGVCELAPGTTLRLDNRGLDIAAYAAPSADRTTWSLQTTHHQTPHDALLTSITHHSRSDRPMSMLLSGGFDSAAIASGFREAGLAPLCLTLATGHNDADVERAIRTATHYGMPHEIVTVDAESLVSRLDEFVTAMDQPGVDGFNTHLITSASARAGCPVALSGAGADEILGGYRYYRAEDRLARLQRIAPLVPSPILGASASIISRAMDRSRARIDGVLRSRSTVERHRAFRSLFTDVEVASLTGAAPPQANSWDVDPEADAHEQFATLDAATYLQPTLLRDGDIHAMWHGVELRLPYVDTAVIDATRRANTALTKSALAEAWDDPYLVEAAAEPKLTFRLPWREWMGAITEATRDVVADTDPWQGLVDRDAAKAVIDIEGSGVAEPLRPWSLLVLAHWLSSPLAARTAQRQISAGDQQSDVWS